MAATLRARLGRAIFVALTPVLALGALSSVLSYRDEVGDRRAVLTQTALRSAAEVRARMESGALILSALAPETSGPDCVPRLRAVAGRVNGYQNLIRLDASGRVVCAAATVAARSSDQNGEWFRRLSAGEPLVIAPSPEGFGANGPALIAASRVERLDGGFDGALVSVMSLSSLRPRFAGQALPEATDVAVVDRRGRLVASEDAAEFAASLQLPETADGVKLFRAADRRGEQRDHAAARLLDDEVFVVLSAPAPGIFSWARLNLLFSVVIPLLAFGAAFGAVWLATDRLIVRWLHYLQRIAAVYARGRFTVRPAVAEDAPEEVRLLARTLDEMADTITKRDQLLREGLAQKDALLREIHHRVKNNLQVITSLLNLQQRALADPAGRAVLADTRQRITALALIYRALYQSEDLRRVDVRSFLEELVGHLVNGEGPRSTPIRAEVRADELMLDPDKLAPFALFAVEAVTNAQKHAFPTGGGNLVVRFEVQDSQAILEVRDDGAGADLEAIQGGVGRTLMNAFARQLRGRMELEGGGENGVTARLVFPLPEPAVAHSS